MKKLLSALLIAGILTGCAAAPEEKVEPVQEEQVQEEVIVTVSQYNGEEVLVEATIPLEEGQSVMDVMKENFDLEEDQGFITGIEGVVADPEKKEAWFYAVNGEDAMVGAADYKLKAGDKVSFDLHNWE